MATQTQLRHPLTLHASEWALLSQKQQIIVRALLQHQFFGVTGEYLKQQLGYVPAAKTRAHVAHIYRLRTLHPNLRFVIQHHEGKYWLVQIIRQ